MAAAETAILAQFQAVGRMLFVLLGIVVAALTVLTRHHYHNTILFFCHYNPNIK
jgi:hypothetical protein